MCLILEAYIFNKNFFQKFSFKNNSEMEKQFNDWTHKKNFFNPSFELAEHLSRNGVKIDYENDVSDQADASFKGLIKMSYIKQVVMHKQRDQIEFDISEGFVFKVT
jgi:hypothetical protein